jgi:hypothetical protein
MRELVESHGVCQHQHEIAVGNTILAAMVRERTECDTLSGVSMNLSAGWLLSLSSRWCGVDNRSGWRPASSETKYCMVIAPRERLVVLRCWYIVTMLFLCCQHTLRRLADIWKKTVISNFQGINELRAIHLSLQEQYKNDVLRMTDTEEQAEMVSRCKIPLSTMEQRPRRLTLLVYRVAIMRGRWLCIFSHL